MMTNSEIQPRTPFPFWKWFGITTLGWLAGWPVSWSVNDGPAMGRGEFWVVLLLAGGAAIGVGQQLLAWRWDPAFRFWFFATLLGTALAVGLVVIAVRPALPTFLRILLILLALCMPGIAQWLVLPANPATEIKRAFLLIAAWASATVTLAFAALLFFSFAMTSDGDLAIAVIVIGNLAAGMLLGSLSALAIRRAITA